MATLKRRSPKYQILSRLENIHPVRARKQKKAMILSLLQMQESDFDKIANSNIQDDHYFEKWQLDLIARGLNVKVTELHAFSRYTISHLINASINPSATLKKIHDAFTGIYARVAIRNKIYSMSGDRNCFTKAQLELIARTLEVSVDDLYTEPTRVLA